MPKAPNPTADEYGPQRYIRISYRMHSLNEILGTGLPMSPSENRAPKLAWKEK